MTETNLYRKNKINLEDYDYERDIKNRLILSRLSPDDLEILEEIIYSPTKFPIHTLVSQSDKPLEKVQETLEKLLKTDLFSIDGNEITVNKEVRKHFEIQILKFEENFTPGIEFLQALLKKVPIHVLPNWYPIPRTSNNIFNSLIEKYLETPQTFQRYLSEVNFGDPVLNEIISLLFASPDYKIYSKEIKASYDLDDQKFEEYMLYLEFNFLGCLVYEKEENEPAEIITLFDEWKHYLSFIKESQPKEIDVKGSVKQSRPHDFSFIEDLSTVLILSSKTPLHLKLDHKEEWILEKEPAQNVAKKCKGFNLKTEEGQAFFFDYSSKLIQKLIFLKLAYIEKSQLIPTPEAQEWVSLPFDKRAINTYKLTVQRYPFSEFPQDICTERNIHEIEKSVSRILDSGWVFLEDFLKGVIAPISDQSRMVLKKTGRYWKYTLPNYSQEELLLIRKVIFEWLFEAGIVNTGTFKDKECLRITDLGKSMFG